jgi:hypothetical protein
MKARFFNSSRRWFGILTFLISIFSAHAKDPSRAIPGSLPSHPGNVFLAGEPVVVAAPPGDANTWRMMNYEDNVVAKGEIKNGRVELGQLPVGFYKIVRGAGGQITNRTWLGVLEPLHAPTPETSPISTDLGMAWFFPSPKEKMEEVASLCQLAGMNWVRDRLLWNELEPQRGKFVPETRYDLSARVQSAAGLKVLQVTHVSTPWANPNGKRFPLDLRDFYYFYRELARRWENKVLAFEPWNEADISVFGGHAGSEMASFQKAAYLGLKAGNPNVIACQNVFAIRRAETLADFNDNKAWPYFDTYNLHTYEPLEKYPDVYAAHRAVSGGKPMWTTETSIHVKWKGDEQRKELSQADERLQSEQLTKTYALALHEGAEKVFYFVLPHYTEGKLQYGLLRANLTPRPGYVALAAVGRLLADAKPLGKLKADESVHGYLFDAKPDGEPANVLVLWADKETSFALPQNVKRCFDHLGRMVAMKGGVVPLTQAPLYAILSKETKLDLIAPPQPAKLLRDKPGNVVLQAILPETDIVLEKSAYKMAAGETKKFPVYVYNFGAEKLHGKLKVTAPQNWTAELSSTVELAPGDRKELTLTLCCPKTETWTEASLRITGDFGAGEKPVLALRFTSRK